MPDQPITYLAGHIKHNPDTGEVALRTIFPEDQGPQMANMAWLIATKNTGARNARSEEVLTAEWVDMYEPEPPALPPMPPMPLNPPVLPPSGINPVDSEEG